MYMSDVDLRLISANLINIYLWSYVRSRDLIHFRIFVIHVVGDFSHFRALIVWVVWESSFFIHVVDGWFFVLPAFCSVVSHGSAVVAWPLWALRWCAGLVLLASCWCAVYPLWGERLAPIF